MGLENRDYLRSDFDDNSRRFSAASTSIVTKLIVVTVIVFVLQLLTSTLPGQSAVQSWLQLSMGDLFQGQIWRLVTYAFCHSQRDILHLVMNMALLYFTGRIVVNLTGDREFLWLYLTSAVFAGVTGVTAYRLMQMDPMIIGASGAVYAIFTIVAMHYPRLKVLVFGIFPMEIRWLLAIYLAFDLYPVISGRSNFSQVAHSCHLGGALFGFLYVRWHMNLTRWWDQFAGRIRMGGRNRGRLKVYAPPAQPETSLDDQVDAILEKISQQGEASLTPRERNILTQASRQLRKNRT